MMNKSDLETKKVAELKQMSRERGLTLESKGHKFTKSELIERLLQSQDEQNDINKKIEEAGCEDNEKWDEPVLEHIEVEEEKQEESDSKDGYIRFARTIEEIEKKYAKPKRDFVYDEFLKVGSFIVFIQYAEALDGNIYKKLRTAKVIAVNRGKKLVRVETAIGTTVELSFDELLFIKSEKYNQNYPKDINRFLFLQRARKDKTHERHNEFN